MDFARDQLQKHGWKEGAGLGRTESGMKEAIKVKMKFDTAGVGHNAGDEFTYHWWDHMFNKALDSIKVENKPEGVSVKKDKDFSLTNKRPLTKSLANKDMLYGRFIKSSTLTQDKEAGMKEVNEASSSDSESDEDVPGIAFSHLTDDDLVRICGGRTAHKAARHGLKLNGKLKRIEEHEALHSQQNSENNSSDEAAVTKSKKKKKKRSRDKEMCEIFQLPEMPDISPDGSKRKKKKKRKMEEESSDILDNEHEIVQVKKSKKKKKEKDIVDSNVETNCRQEVNTQEVDYIESRTTDDNESCPKKKCQKSKKNKKNR